MFRAFRIGAVGLGSALKPASVRVGGVTLAASAAVGSSLMAGEQYANPIALVSLVFSTGPEFMKHAAETASAIATSAANIINWEHVRSVVHYEQWPNVPPWVKIALLFGGSSFLLYRVWMWIWNRKRFEPYRRAVSFYKKFLPMVIDYKWTQRKVC